MIRRCEWPGRCVILELPLLCGHCRGFGKKKENPLASFKIPPTSRQGSSPATGMHIILPACLLGPNRGRYFLSHRGQTLSARQA
jgi:hypothetical protein